jgi:transposase
LLKDIDAGRNAVILPYSNGFVEGTNSKLKMIKSTMYGRAKLPLLRCKIILSAK